MWRLLPPAHLCVAHSASRLTFNPLPSFISSFIDSPRITARGSVPENYTDFYIVAVASTGTYSVRSLPVHISRPALKSSASVKLRVTGGKRRARHTPQRRTPHCLGFPRGAQACRSSGSSSAQLVIVFEGSWSDFFEWVNLIIGYILCGVSFLLSALVYRANLIHTATYNQRLLGRPPADLIATGRHVLRHVKAEGHYR